MADICETFIHLPVFALYMQFSITVSINHDFRICDLTGHVFHDSVLCHDALSERLFSAPSLAFLFLPVGITCTLDLI
jgi:hypothetical protein